MNLKISVINFPCCKLTYHFFQLGSCLKFCIYIFSLLLYYLLIMVELGSPKSPVKEGINNMIFILPMILVGTLVG